MTTPISHACYMHVFMSIISVKMLGAKGILTPLIPNYYVLLHSHNSKGIRNPPIFLQKIVASITENVTVCSRSKFLTKLLKTFDKTFREIFPVFISTKRREKPSAFFDNNFVNNAYFSEAASSSPSHLASSSSKAPISSRMTCLCLWSS